MTLKRVRSQFQTQLAPLCDLARASENIEVFKEEFAAFVEAHKTDDNRATCQLLQEMIAYDGKEVFELSTETHVPLQTITLLWHFLNEREGEESCVTIDFAIDIFHQIEGLFRHKAEKPSPAKVVRWMERWPSGMDRAVIAIREENKKRIVRWLVERIEHHHSPHSRYVFPEGIDRAEKEAMVESWWNDHRFHLTMAIRSPRELNHAMGGTLSAETLHLYHEARKKGIPVFITPYYLSLLNPTGQGYDDSAIRSYVMYSRNLVETFGQIRAWEKEDIVEPGKPNAAGWMLPEGGNIHRRYPDVAILIPDTMGRACGGLCASCQRMYDFQRGHLNFDLDELKPKETWQHKLNRLMDYFAEDAELKDILITGGDALMSQNKSLRVILEAVYKMAVRKRTANLRADAASGKKAEMQRVRLGSRLPVYLPMRVNDELVEILRDFRIKGESVGIKQFFIQTHFQTPLEVTPEAKEAVRKLRSAGWTVTNQLVYNVAASRRGHTAKLRQVLNCLGVLCYYTFSVKGFEENHDVFAPNSRSLQEQQEEKCLGNLTAEQRDELLALLADKERKTDVLKNFCKRHSLPFVASDRSVLNLPGIGKSMTFSVIGIMPDGRRMLIFDHDHTRRHSSVIEQMPKVFIRENKSIWEYLCQLAAAGEDLREYESLWLYTAGKTERRFPFFEYTKS